MTPGRVAELRRTYNVILRNKVPDDADIADQHAYWRLHDAAKHEYAKADWQWESAVLKVLIAGAAVFSVASALSSSLVPVALVALVLVAAQTYRIMTRFAPD